MAQSTDALPPPSRPRRRPWAKALLIIGIVLAVLAVGAAASAFVVYQKLNQITVIQAPTTEVPDTGKKAPLNILLMGSDSRTGKGNQRYGLDSGRGGERSDTTILLHVAADRSRAFAVSIPRDLWVEQPKCALQPGEYPYYAKFNNAFEMGGAPCTVELVHSMTGVPINHMAVVDFQGFKRVVDALGGVEVCLVNPVNDPASKLVLPAGKSVVTGEDALAFVRARKSLGDGSDIGRINRQQLFLSSAIRKVTDTGVLLNPARMYSVLDTATKALTVDQSLDSVTSMSELANSMRTITPDKVTFSTMPFVYRDDGANVDLDTAKAAPMWKAMADDTAWPPPPSTGPDGKHLTIPASDITVTVTAPQAALERVVSELQAAGFNVGDSWAQRSSGSTRVVYPPSLEDSARTVAYAAKAVMVADSGASGIRLEIGRDHQGIDPAITLAKPKSQSAGPSAAPADPSTGTGGEITKADKVTCAN